MPSWGVYAPIPSQETGSVLTVSVEGGVHFDSNILGTPDNEIDSMVFTVSPQIKYNVSLAEQSFLTAHYKLGGFFYEQRPSDDTLFNHELYGKLSHTFSPSTFLDISESFSIIDNPESFLDGLLQTNQSFNQNIFNIRFRAEVTEALSLTAKYRNTNFSYDDASIAESLDRNDHLLGLEAGWKLLPDTSVVVEYRYEDLGYDADGNLKDSDSSFFLFGADYQPSPTFLTNGRFGVQDRNRSIGTSNTNFYAEFTVLFHISVGFVCLFRSHL